MYTYYRKSKRTPLSFSEQRKDVETYTQDIERAKEYHEGAFAKALDIDSGVVSAILQTE